MGKFKIYLVLVLAISVIAMDPKPKKVLACWAAPSPHIIDSTLAASDTIPPAPPTVSVHSIDRGSGPRYTKSGSMKISSTDHGGSILLLVKNAPIDRIQGREIGYEIEYVRGEVPYDCVIGTRPTKALYLKPLGATIPIHWNDGARDEQEAFDFRIIVRSIDMAGNRSENSEIVIISDLGSEASN